jgi:hypothetical protein
MFNWARRAKAQPATVRGYSRAFSMDGVLVSAKAGPLPSATAVSSPELDALLNQLEEEGFAVSSADGYLLPWERVYELFEHPDHAEAMQLLRLPTVRDVAPLLESHGSLLDPDFTIAVSGWQLDGATLDSVKLTGAVLEHAKGSALLPRASFETVRRVGAFARRDASERTDTANRRLWGLIRSEAMEAKARLDAFLYQTVVLTPERLDIKLRKAENLGTKLVEVQPVFHGAPVDWLNRFDKLANVPDRYDIPTRDGIVQVLLTPPVKAVLQQIKRMPGRRVAGTRAPACA